MVKKLKKQVRRSASGTLSRRKEAEANRRLFWGAYLARVGDHPLLPHGAEDTLTLRRAWELRKAVYEVGYELGHRPDWVGTPLRFLLEGGRP